MTTIIVHRKDIYMLSICNKSYVATGVYLGSPTTSTLNTKQTYIQYIQSIKCAQHQTWYRMESFLLQNYNQYHTDTTVNDAFRCAQNMVSLTLKICTQIQQR